MSRGAGSSSGAALAVVAALGLGAAAAAALAVALLSGQKSSKCVRDLLQVSLASSHECPYECLLVKALGNMPSTGRPLCVVFRALPLTKEAWKEACDEGGKLVDFAAILEQIRMGVCAFSAGMQKLLAFPHHPAHAPHHTI